MWMPFCVMFLQLKNIHLPLLLRYRHRYRPFIRFQSRNFRFPYFSRDIAEFWRRWHISSTTWFRDYIYIPLGGSRCAQWRGECFQTQGSSLCTEMYKINGKNKTWSETLMIWGLIGGVEPPSPNRSTTGNQSFFEKVNQAPTFGYTPTCFLRPHMHLGDRSWGLPH
jgi:hypothetical protein